MDRNSFKHQALCTLQGEASRHRRGAFFIWFALVGLPFLLIGLTLSSDLASVIDAQREVRLAAESAAVAGSYQIDEDSGQLNPNAAKQAAEETFQHAVATGALAHAVNATGTATVTPFGVSMNVQYEVDSLTAFKVLNAFIGDIQWVGAINTVETARVCDPGNSSATAGPSDGECVRPDTSVVVTRRGANGSLIGSGSGSRSTNYPGHYPVHYPVHYPAHYPPHYTAHYPVHYTGHYPAHYSAHYPRHYPRHYTAAFYPPNLRRF
jgi:Flp pilus assembly protein TadG